MAEEERLKRLGTLKESAARLARKAAEAEQVLGIHGVSVTAGVARGDASVADRAEIERVFPVHETPTKPGRPAVGPALVAYAAGHAPVPFFAIGGLDATNVLLAPRA